MTRNAAERRLTVEQLSRRIHVSVHKLQAMLADDLARGIVQQHTDGSWSLTDAAERRHGQALRSITNNAAGDA
jgi:hypothetical protein